MAVRPFTREWKCRRRPDGTDDRKKVCWSQVQQQQDSMQLVAVQIFSTNHHDFQDHMIASQQAIFLKKC